MVVSAENLFGQLMICLRMSKLDYLVKETPYSAYVSIRKKFSKSVNSASDMIEVGNVASNDVHDKLEKENRLLKQKLDDLGRECAMVRFEKEEIDIKYEELEKDRISLEDKIEEAYAESRPLRNTISKLSEDNDGLNARLIQAKNENVNLQKSFEKQKKCEKKYEVSLRDFEDYVLMLENVLKNCDLKQELETFEPTTSVSCGKCENEFERQSSLKTHTENDHLQTDKDETDSTSKINQHKCKECEFTGDSEESMKMHMIEKHVVLSFKCDLCDFESSCEEDIQIHKIGKHEVKCEHCEEWFMGENKLEKHMCRICIENPDYMDLYMKNWYRRNDCIPVFSKRLKKEIIILHADHCWEDENFCSELPENFDSSEKSILDENGLLHFPAVKSSTLQKNSICWLALRGLMMEKLDKHDII